MNGESNSQHLTSGYEEQTSKINELIQATRQRKTYETVAACFAIAAALFGVATLPMLSLAYIGCGIVAISGIYIIVKVRKYEVTPEMLQNNPPSHGSYWRAVFEDQAQLLSRVPYWYIAPLFIGVSLYLVPAKSNMVFSGNEPNIFTELAIFLLFELIIITLFAWIIKINMNVANQLRREAQALFA